MEQKGVISTGQMRAQSISIQVSNRERCNAACRFCISRTTPGADTDEGISYCNLDRMRTGMDFAKTLGATHAVLTGKAEPTQEGLGYLCELINTARGEYKFLVDIHTNGFLIQKGIVPLDALAAAGLTMVTFSIASFNDNKNKYLMGIEQNGLGLIEEAKRLGLLVRCSLIYCKSGVNNFQSTMEYILKAGEAGAHMVVIREVWLPTSFSTDPGMVTNPHAGEVFDWNKRNHMLTTPLMLEFRGRAMNPNDWGLKEKWPLPWGAPVFAVENVFSNRAHGVNVTFAHCEENSYGPVIKSIVHKPNGHGYRNWDCPAEILY